MMRLSDQVVIVHPPEIAGPYNSITLDWPNATRTTEPALMRQVGASEDVVLQQRTETRWQLFLRPGAVLAAIDRVEWDNKILEVIGEPETARLSGRLHHTEALLRSVAGG